MKLNRIIIYPKDIQRITGKSEKSGQRIIKKIKEHLGKEEHQFVTYVEFATYTGLDKKAVEEFMM